MVTLGFVELCIYFGIISGSLATKINTYFLNKKFDIRNPLCYECPAIDCLYTKNETMQFPKSMTVCLRVQPITYVNNKEIYSCASLIPNPNVVLV